MSGYRPDSDSALLAFSLNLSTRINSTPVLYGLTSALATAYSALHENFATSLAACDPDERNKIATITKNADRAALIAQIRLLSDLVQGTASVTDAQKAELGLNIRGQPQRIPAPGIAPGLLLQGVEGNTVYVRLVDADKATRRGKPFGVDGATVFSYVGPTAPAESDWKFEFNTARTTAEITFPATMAPASKVWITAFWFNARKERGPAAAPVSTVLLGSAAMAA